MKKTMRKTVALTAGIFCLTGAASAVAGGSGNSMEEMRAQMRQLMEQNEALTARIGQLEQSMKDKEARDAEAAAAEQAAAKAAAEDENLAKKISERVTLSGLIEANFFAGSDFADESTSAFDLATVDLGFDARMSDWVLGHALVEYSGGDDDDVNVDEAFIEIGNTEQFPVVMSAGKLYVPFGKFETNMIQDPLTLEVGEVQDYGLVLGMEASGLYAAAFAYNGMDETGDDSKVNGFGAQAGYRIEQEEGLSLDAGVSWVNNIADSDGVSDAFDEAGLESIHSTVGGFGAHLIGGFGPISLIGEYVQALDTFYPGEINAASGELENAELLFRDQGAEPSAWNVEAAYTAELMGKESVFALGFQGTDESVALGLPETRYIASAGFGIFPGATLTFEYYYDEDYGISDGGTDESANGFTTQLSYEF